MNNKIRNTSRPQFYMRFVVLALMLLSVFIHDNSFGATYYSRVSGNWNSASTWSTASCGGAAAAAFPVAGDIVFICSNHVVTVTADAACASITFENNGTTTTLTINSGFTVTVSGTVTLKSITNANTGCIIAGAGALSCASVNIGGTTNINPANGGPFTNIMTTSIASFNITGNLVLQGWEGTTTARLTRPEFIIENGIVDVNGQINAVSEAGNNISDLIMNTGAQTGTLILSNATPFGASTGTFNKTFTGTGATVNYDLAGAQTVLNPSTYTNLTISGSGAKTTTGVTVNGVLSMEGTATVSAAPTYGAAATLQYNTATGRIAGAEWLATFAATGGVIIANTGVITANAAKVFNASVPLTINSGASLNTGNFQFTFGGNFINNGGTFTAGSSPIIIANTMVTQSIAGFTTTGLVSMTKTAGTATFTGNVNGAGFTLNGNGGTLNLGTGLTHTFTGAWTRTNGILNGGSSILRIGGSVSGTTGTFTAGTGTVEWYAAGVQTLAGVTYNNLTISGSGNKTISTGTTIIGIMSVQGTAVAITNAPAYGAASTLEYKGSALQTATAIEFPAASGPKNLIINNASNVTFPATFPRTITGTVTLTAGILTTVTGSELTVNNTLNTAITGASTTRYISGPLVWYLAAGTTYSFPVGKGGTYYPFELTNITGTAPVIKVEAFNAATGGTASAPLTLLSTTEYWSSSIVSGTYSGGTVSLTRQIAIGTMTAIGRSATQTGAYSNINGTISGTSIINSDNTGASLGFFVMAVGCAQPTITGTTPNSRCGTGTVALGATASAGTVNWYTVSTGGAAVATGTSYTTPSISATTSYYVDATNAGCTTASRTLVLATVNTVPTITGTTPNSRCGTGTVALGATASAGAVNWYTVSTGGAAVATGTSYTTPSISATTSYYVDATNAGCTTASRTLVLATVNAVPTITGTTPNSRCGTGTVALGATASAGVVNWYTVSTGGAAVATGTSYTTPGISATTSYYVDATNAGCTTASRTLVLATVNPEPTITGTTPNSRCGTGTVALGATASAGSVNWYTVSTGGAAVATGTSYTTPGISATTSYYVDATNAGCTTASRTLVLATVNPEPTITGTTPNSRCGTGTVALGATASAGVVNWYTVSTGGAAVATGTSYTTPGISATTSYYVDATNAGCTTASRTLVLATVNPEPTITGTTPNSRCGTGTVALGATASAGSVNWYTVSTGGAAVATGTSYTTPGISATTSYYVDATNAGCTTASRTLVLATVNPEPTITGTTPNSRCGTGTVALGATASAGVVNWYTVSTGGAAVATGTSYTTPGISATTSYYVDATNAGCTTASRTLVLATVNAVPTITGTTPNSRCSTGTVALGATASAGVVNWYTVSTGGAAVATGTSYTTPGISATTSYYVDATNAGCTTASRTLVLATVNPEPTITGTTPNSRCGTGTVALGATASAGAVNWYTVSTGGAAVATGTSFTTPGISATTSYYVDATNAGCTTASRTLVLATVNTEPTITGTTPNSRCGTGTVTLGATASAGTVNWYTVSTGGAAVATGTSYTTPSISATTSYYVDATNAGCTTTSRTNVTATVFPPTPAQPGAISGSASVNQNTSGLIYSITAVANATTYTWTVPTGWTINSGQGTISISVTSGNIGQDGNITVTAGNSCGTSSAQILAVTVLTAECPSSTATAPATTQTVCQGIGTGQLTATITTTGSGGSPTFQYQWYFNSSNSNTIAGATLISGATSSTYTPLSGVSEVGTRYYFCVGYAADNGCGQSNSTQSLASNTVQVTVNPAAPSAPTANAGSGAGCTQITSNWSSSANATSYSLDVSAVNDFASFVPGYQNLDVGNVTTYNVTTLSAGNTYYYRVRAVNNCGTSANSGTITYATLPATPDVPGAITGSNSVNPLTSGLVYSISAVTNATAYTWTVPTGWVINSGQGTTSISSTSGASGQSGNITVTAENSCGTSVVQTLAVTVLTTNCPASASVAPAGTQTLCQGIAASQLTTTPTLSGGPGSPTILYQWYYNSSNSNTIIGATSVAGATSDTYTPLSGAGEVGTRYYFCVSYAIDNGCGQSNTTQSLASNTVQITVNPGTPATPGTISGPSSASPSATGIVYSITAVTNATTYTWTVPTGWTITAGDGTTSITVTAGILGQDGDITVTAGNTCGTSTQATKAVTVSNITITLGSSPTVCRGTTSASLPYTATEGSPNQYSIDYDATANTRGFADVVNAALPASPINLVVPGAVLAGTYNGSLTVRNSGSGSVSIVYPITVTVINTTSTANAGTTASICATGTRTLNATAPTYGTGAWTFYSGPNTNISQINDPALRTAVFTPAGGTGNYVIRWTVSNSPCASTWDTVTIRVNPVPTTSNAGPDQTVYCATTATLAANTPVNGTGAWTVVSGGSTVTTPSSPTSGVTNLAVGTNSFRWTISSTGCTNSLDNIIVTRATLPAVPGTISGQATALANQPGYTYSVSIVTYATTYTWTVPASWTITAGQGTRTITVTSGNEGQNGNITVTAGNPCGTSAASTKAVTCVFHSPHGDCGECHMTSHSGMAITPITGNTAFCVNCHNPGGTALDKPFTDAMKVTKSHAWDVTAINATYETNIPANADMQSMMNGNLIICSTCHEQHNPYTANYLRISNTGDALCKECHQARNLGSYASNPTNIGSHPVGENYPSNSDYHASPTNPKILTPGSKVECTSCHGVHDNQAVLLPLTNDGNLLRATNDNNLCKSCHNYSTHQTNDCNICHKVHKTGSNIMLVPSLVGGFAITFSAKTGANSFVDGDAVYTGICEACHTTKTYFVNANRATPGTSGTSHNWDIDAVNATYETNIPSDAGMMARVFSNKITCVTCHNQHTDNSLRVSTAGDALCKQCHSARNIGTYAQNNVTNKGSHPVGINYPGAIEGYNATPTDPKILLPGSKVECTSCHGVHDPVGTIGLTNDGNLLRVTNNSSLCSNCHTFGLHNGMNCLVCHQAHNSNKTNVFMIRDMITTPNSGNKNVIFAALTGANSFADGDATYNGVCEVCHTTTSHYRNDGSGADQSHTSQGGQNGQNCTTCHTHQSNFSGGSCVTCHAVQQGTAPVRPQITGTGGEFDKLSKHTSIAPVVGDCQMCHYEVGGLHKDKSVAIRDVDNDVEWTGDMDVYCVKCHDGAPPTGISFPAPTAKYNKSAFIGTPHDYLTNSCAQCHNDHGSDNADLLLQNTNYAVCRTCHDGAPGTNIDVVNKAVMSTSGTSHAWDVSAINASAGAGNPTDPTLLARLSSGNIVCSTCHDPHNNTNTKFLVNANNTDQMCKDCHSERNVGSYPAKGSHPVGVNYTAGGTYANPAPTWSATEVGPIGGIVQCSSCHKTHNSTTNDGRLLRKTFDSGLCQTCHTLGSTAGSPLGTHNGMTCTDCHDAHGTGNNIYLVKNTITTPSSGNKAVLFTALTGINSFADGNATYDGVCEVCHTTTLHHRNTAAGDHMHENTANCTTCHLHSENFSAKLCSQCHNTGQGTRPQIFGAGGEFDNTSKHTAAAPTDNDCEICHYQDNHMQGTVGLKDPDATAAWTGDKDVYCIKCHDGAPPAGVTFPIPTAKYNKSTYTGTLHDTYATNSCLLCHNDHGSPNANLLLQATNYAVCNSCHNGGPARNISSANIAIPGTSGNTHAWDKAAVNGTLETNTPSDANMSTRLSGANIVCSTCHNSHDNTNTSFLVSANGTDQMCKDCHSARNKARYIDNVANKGTHPVGITYPTTDPDYNAAPTSPIVTLSGKVECSSCHGMHEVTGVNLTEDGNLLRSTNDITLCQKCHTYSTHQTNACSACHETHNTNKTNILMVKNLIGASTVTFTAQSGTNSYADGVATTGAICGTCHTSKNYFVNAKKAIPGTSGNSHAWDVLAVNATYETNNPSNAGMLARVYGSMINCVTCHNQHSDAIPKALRMSNTGDAMCKDCHSARNKGKWVSDPANNKGTHPVGITYPVADADYNATPTSPIITVGGNVECSSCHGVHDVAGTTLTNDGMLLRSTNNATLCQKCHKYNSHQGMDCIKCHDVHNTVKTNIYEVRNTIATPNSGNKTVVFTAESGAGSFADGAAPYDGVCEVCHTLPAASYHLNNAVGTHENGNNCTTSGCHPHSGTESFAKPNCVDCHNLIAGHTTNAHAAHTTGQYAFACSLCHLNQGSGGSSEPSHPSGGAGEVTLNTANALVGATATYNSVAKTCSNVYCHSNGQGTFTTTPSYASGTITTCTPCHVQNISVVPTYVAPATGAHAAHYGTPYQFICSTCHNGLSNTSATHVDGNKDVIFNPTGLAKRNGSDANTPTWNSGTKTCGTVYCHSDGRSAYRGTDGTDTWSSTIGSQAATYTTTPSWATGTITVCSSCHTGVGNMTSPFTITTPGPVTGTADVPATGSHQRGAHTSNSQELSGNGYANVNCFWCHNTNSGKSNTPMNQGTYGTTYHVDGLTFFKPRSVIDGGTMVGATPATGAGSFSYSKLGSAAHCGQGKQCW